MKISSIFVRPTLLLFGALACAPILIGGCGGATSTPALPSGYAPNADLTYAAVSPQSNAYTARVTALETSGANNLNGSILTGGDGTSNLELSGINRIVNVTTERRFDVFLESPAGQGFVVGQRYPLAFGTRNNILVRQSNPNGDRLWQSDGGVATITSVSSNSIQLSLSDARFTPSPTFFAFGTFLLNGTIGATKLRAAGR